MSAITLDISKTQLFHLESLVNKRIVELKDFAIELPHCKHLSDEQLAHYEPLHAEILKAISESRKV